jgi:transcriptional regulator with GAF, ATPase, and Fis domain
MFPVVVPPLRERLEDTVPLGWSFINEFSSENTIASFSVVDRSSRFWPDRAVSGRPERLRLPVV